MSNASGKPAHWQTFLSQSRSSEFLRCGSVTAHLSCVGSDEDGHVQGQSRTGKVEDPRLRFGWEMLGPDAGRVHIA